MGSALFVMAVVAGFTAGGLCCRPKEYITHDGRCCPVCARGTIVREDCKSRLHDTRCGPCPMGTFMNQDNGFRSCFPCSSCDSGAGLFAEQICTAASNRVCGVLDGYFCKSLAGDTGCSLAEKHSQCSPGQRIKEPGTSKSDTVCESCQSGYFSLSGVNCTAWTVCTEPQVKVLEGNSSSDVVCGPRRRHHYFVFLPLHLVLCALIFVLC